ncbi:MAG TPA: hypothetical protein VKE72_07080 [Methylocella sp.]|nr:hypothetical protein [Methylocella sp.]
MSAETALSIPAQLTALFARPPLLVTESASEYDGLFTAVAETIKPSDNIEWIGTAKYVGFIWDSIRWRRAKADIINMTFPEALATVLEALLPDSDDRADVAARLVDDWYEKPAERQTIVNILAKHGLSPDAVAAEAIALRADELEKLDRMLQQVEVAGMAQLREIEFHRRASSWRAPDRLKDIIDQAVEPIQLPKPEEAAQVGLGP